jgi:hypothetical protein
MKSTIERTQQGVATEFLSGRREKVEQPSYLRVEAVSTKNPESLKEKPMALFSRMVRQLHHRNGSDAVVVIERPKPRLPDYYRRLRVLCHRHPLPVQMNFGGFTDSHGQRVAVYVCPCHGCGSRQAWARHRVTGKPFRLS